MQVVQTIKILIIEDQLIIAADMQLQLVQMGYEVIGIHQCPDEAILTIQKDQPDLVMIDIGWSTNYSGIKTAQYILATTFVPILFLSYSLDQTTFQKIKQIKSYAFIPKPFQQTDLQKGIKTALERIAWEKQLEIRRSKK